jgi:ketosteroid isomerase-like protein
MLSLVAGACAMTPDDCEVPPPAAAAAEIRVLNQAYIDAARDNDAAWFNEYMASDVVIVNGSGQRLGKAQFIENVNVGRRRLRALTVRDVTVRVFGKTVQVDADAPFELEDGHRGISRYIDTWAWIDCRWQVISAQINTLPDTSASSALGR